MSGPTAAALAVLLLAASGCETPVSLPPEPRLTSIELLTQGESGTLLLGFEDGDGNFGLEQADTTGAFCPSCPFHHNVFCVYQEFRNGEWVSIELNTDLGEVPFFYRAPLISPTGQNKTQRRPSWHRKQRRKRAWGAVPPRSSAKEITPAWARDALDWA